MMNGELSKNGKRWSSFIRKNTNTSSPQYKSFSDFFGAVTNNQIKGAFTHEGFSDILNVHLRYDEAFANFVEIMGNSKSELKLITMLIPNISDVVKNLILRNM